MKCVFVILLILSLNHPKRITIPCLPWSGTPLTTTNARAVITKFPWESLAKYWKEWSAIWHADVFWPPTQLNTYRSQSVDFTNYCCTCYMAPRLSDWSLVAREFCSYWSLWSTCFLHKIVHDAVGHINQYEFMCFHVKMSWNPLLLNNDVFISVMFNVIHKGTYSIL